MKLKFKHQQFQADAAKAVCDVFIGQPCQSGMRYLVDPGKSRKSAAPLMDMHGYRNAPLADHMDSDKLRNNLHAVQERNLLKHSGEFSQGINLTVEMETGTGKTYTYIKTMYELNKQYGWTKFIIVVPSVAIREGVYKSFAVTQEHFASDYGKKIRYFIYDSKNLTEIDRFAADSAINVMIINAQAFNATGKDARRINMKLDAFRSRRPIDVIAATNPILIIDEPQSVEGKKTKEKLKAFNPLMTLRYSATPREEYNIVYRLDAIDAYNKKLVKKIAVKGITASTSMATGGYVFFSEIKTSKVRPPMAVLDFDKKGKNSIRSIRRTLGEGENLYQLSGELEEYKGNYIISRINANTNTVEFVNGITLHVGEAVGDFTEDQLRRVQIRETILSHLQKEQQLFRQGIKVLSLFFIDEVAKYRVYDEGSKYHNGEYAKMFEEEYQDVLDNFQTALDDTDYQKYLEAISAHKTHQGYFSVDKKGKMINSPLKRKETSSDDIDAYTLIMKDKERLLDLDPKRSPVRFIFSHSALREGWDNPNVFQICTLKQSESDVGKRQEVGRGMRLCVNQDGERMDYNRLGNDIHRINTLTVIASESYKDFAGGLQRAIADDVPNRPRKVTANLFEDKKLVSNTGANKLKVDSDLAAKLFISLAKNDYIDDDGKLTAKYEQDYNNAAVKLPEAVADYSQAVLNILSSVYSGEYAGIENDRDKNTEVRLDEDKINRQAFKNLWKQINHKSVYAVEFDSAELVRKAVDALNRKLRVAPLYFTVETGSLQEIASKEQLIAGKAFVKETGGTDQRKAKVRVNNGIKYDLVGKLVVETGLTRKAIVGILTQIKPEIFNMFKANPEEFIIKTAGLINDEKATVVVEHITYRALEETYDTDIFTEPNLKARLGENAIAADRCLYDHVIYDSANECNFAQDLEADKNISVYVKLPGGFFIDTPVGHYNPDWAIAFKEGSVKHIYFVAETKGSMNSMQLRLIEDTKIKCARKHFAAISSEHVVYDVIDSYKSLVEKVMK